MSSSSTGNGKGGTFDNALIFQRVLISQLSPNIGKKVLGRLGLGAAKPGQSPPFTLSEATTADRETATRYLQYVTGQQVTSVAPNGRHQGTVGLTGGRVRTANASSSGAKSSRCSISFWPPSSDGHARLFAMDDCADRLLDDVRFRS